MAQQFSYFIRFGSMHVGLHNHGSHDHTELADGYMRSHSLEGLFGRFVIPQGHLRSLANPLSQDEGKLEGIANKGSLGNVGQVEPGSPWENGYVESFNGKMRDELLLRELFYSLKEAQVLIEMWRKHYNTFSPHNSLGYGPPAPETIVGQPSQFQQFSLTL